MRFRGSDRVGGMRRTCRIPPTQRRMSRHPVVLANRIIVNRQSAGPRTKATNSAKAARSEAESAEVHIPKPAHGDPVVERPSQASGMRWSPAPAASVDAGREEHCSSRNCQRRAAPTPRWSFASRRTCGSTRAPRRIQASPEGSPSGIQSLSSRPEAISSSRVPSHTSTRTARTDRKSVV